MRILYGVVGEGMGHAMRSQVVLEYLVAAGHDVRIVVSGRASEYLAARHPGRVTRIRGLQMVYEDNVLKKMKTALKNLEAIRGLPGNFAAYIEMASSFSPDIVISDFESWTYLFARGQQIPCLSVDNMQIIARCHHADEIIEEKPRDFQLTKQIVKGKLPKCNAYLITTFFFPRIKKERTTLHPPLLRRVILDAKAGARRGDHVLVYQSGTSHDSLVTELKEVDAEFRVYGLRRDLEADEREDNLLFRPFSESVFIDDLKTCRSVVAGGGFTLMGEAVFLGKPMLSVPIRGQFEQVLNANYLSQLGYGERASAIDGARVEAFLARSDRYADSLGEFEHDQNEGLLERLDAAMEEAVDEGARGLDLD